jgi:serine/threonine-protein kinase
MGDFNSASSFYMPIYDLFGKTLRIDIGHRGSEIQNMVKDGRADIGAGALSLIQDKPEFRVIHVSRKIPGAGVYFSPSLSASDRTVIQNVLLGAPQEIRDGANYGKGQEVDYASFVAISHKVEELLACTNFSDSVVQLFCGTSAKLPTLPVGQEDQTIMGRINGFSYSSADTLTLTLSGQNGKTYQIVMRRSLLNTIPDTPPPPGLNGKTVQIRGVTPTSKNDVLELQITKTEQFKVIQKP